MAWVSINALMLAWNNISVIEYIQIMFDEIFHGIVRKSQLILCFTFYPHMMHMTSRQVKLSKVEGHAKKVCLEAMTAIIHSLSLGGITRRVEAFFIILIYPKECEDIDQAVIHLSNLKDEE